ncbi:hypothetical protein P280DRAFT_469509 [Massarina eburnea CBS 473.64]|uniref:Uncharacterized protein n=1 Tax=Massarina eburnea CBS 473.64 TaxID=1395130 RepID=A0A6A6S297_9PLEO|nr:hypothetical protein P280DRAFT_469509 [Massarina eburnea CBS 473.64]
MRRDTALYFAVVCLQPVCQSPPFSFPERPLRGPLNQSCPLLSTPPSFSQNVNIHTHNASGTQTQTSPHITSSIG